MARNDPFPVVMVDDDPDDRLMARRGLAASTLPGPFLEFSDGDLFLDYLASDEGASDKGRPGLVLLDLNMPRLDGWEVLRRMKLSDRWRTIPVVVLTTSQRETDVLSSYRLGAASFITKPMTYKELVEAFDVIAAYWLSVATMP